VSGDARLHTRPCQVRSVCIANPGHRAERGVISLELGGAHGSEGRELFVAGIVDRGLKKKVLRFSIQQGWSGKHSCRSNVDCRGVAGAWRPTICVRRRRSGVWSSGRGVETVPGSGTVKSVSSRDCPSLEGERGEQRFLRTCLPGGLGRR